MVAPLLWMSQGLAWGGEARQLRMKWEELGSKLLNQKVALLLPDGTHVQGKVLQVEEGGLRLNVTKSSNRNVQRKGKHLISRQSISVLHLTEYRKIGRLLGTTVAIAAAAGIVAASYPDLYEGPTAIIVPAVTAGGMIGVAIGGYYAGKAFDKKVTEIWVEPAKH
jgi:hypothetical protein